MLHGEERLCSDGGDSSALSGQTLLCSGIVFALESEVPGSNLRAGTDSALGTTIGDEDVEKESMLQFICVDTYFITDYGVFCGINAGLFKWNRIVYRPQHCGRWNHPTQVSSLQKGEECSDGGDSSALSGQTLLCSGIVFALESEVPGSNLRAGTDSALGTTAISLFSVELLILLWLQAFYCNFIMNSILRSSRICLFIIIFCFKFQELIT